VLDNNPATCDALFDDWTGSVREVVVDCQDFDLRRNQHRVTNSDAPLSTHHHRLADESIAADPDVGVWEVAKVEDVQLGVVHDACVIANCDATRRRVQVHTFVEVDAAAELEVARMTDTDPGFDGWDSLQPHDRPIRHTPQADPQHTREIAEQSRNQAL